VVDVDGVEKREGKFEVYNFNVEGFHTYFVSDLGILVHNTCGDFDIPDVPIGGLKGVDDKWLKNQGVDPHTIKEILPGAAKEFDIYKDKNNNLWGLRKPKYVPNAIPEYLGNLEDFTN
ncbi:hypothetical protein, partial [Nodularia chucula]|uniref:hypothetical protein n=1 Tax=Nodularia chucula TaxID=3093667 RepID=UPI0039C616D3